MCAQLNVLRHNNPSRVYNHGLSMALLPPLFSKPPRVLFSLSPLLDLPVRCATVFLLPARSLRTSQTLMTVDLDVYTDTWGIPQFENRGSPVVNIPNRFQ